MAPVAARQGTVETPLPSPTPLLRMRLTALLCALACTSPWAAVPVSARPTATPASARTAAAAQDPLVAKAVQRIAEVESSEAKLAAGDPKAADALLGRLTWAEKRLGAVVQQGTAEWKAAKARHDAVKAKIVAKKAKPAPAPTPAPNPTPKPKTPPKTPPGGTPPKTPPKTPPGGTPPKTPTYDHEKVVRLNDDVNRAFENIKLLQFKHFLDANRVNGMRREIEGFRSRLEAFPADHPNVKVVAQNLANHESLFQLGVDRVAEDSKTAPAIQAKLEALLDQYSDEDFPSRIEPPYAETQVRAWARELQRRRDVAIPADLAWLDEAAQNVVVDANRIKGVRSHLTVSIQRRLGESERYVVESLDGRASDGVRAAEWVMETDPDDRDQVLGRILGEGRFDESMQRLREAKHFIAMAAIMDEELKRAEHPDRAAQTEAVDAAAARLEELVRLTLSEVRLPEPASEDPKLLKTAAETLKKEKYEVGEWRALVINAPLKSHERREAWLDADTVRATVTFYTYAWEQYQVTTVEEVEGELWLFANTLKRYSSGDRTTPVGEWILSRRFKLTPILEEHVGG